MAGLLDYNRGNFQSNANLTWEKKKRERYGLPTVNVPNVAPSSSVSPTNSIPTEPKPDNTINTLQSLLSAYQGLKGTATQPAQQTPELQAYKPANLEYNKPSWLEQQSIPQSTPVTQPGQATPEQPTKTKGLWDYWKQPVWEGGMPLDQFVTMAGMLAHSIAPESVGGKMGAGLAGMAGPIYKERMAQEAKVAEPKKPQIESVGQRLYGIGGTAEAPVATALTPEPIAPLAPRYTETIKDGIYGEINPITQAFYPVREATLADKARIVEKPIPEMKPEIKSVVGPGGKPELRRVSGTEDKPYTPYYQPTQQKAGGIGNDGSMAKVGNLAAVTKELASKYLSLAKGNIPAGSTTGTASINNLMLSLQPTDQFSGSINDARLRDTLTQEQRDSYDWVKIRAQELASKHPPAKAVNEALKEWRNFNKTSEGTQKQSKVKTIIRYNAQGQRMQ